MWSTPGPTIKGRSKKLLGPLIILWFFIVWPFVLIPIRDPSPDLPAPLKPLLQRVPSVTYPAPGTPPEWKRPLTFTAYATENIESGTVKLILFTTGVDTVYFGRSFNAVGCLVGNHAAQAVFWEYAMVICNIRRELLTEGASVTVAVKLDEELIKAMEAKNQTLSGERYTFQDGDVVPLSQTPKELQEVAEKVAAIRTLVKWHDGYIDKPTGTKHELCMMTAMRQYPYLLKDWISFYRRMGVDKFYIYENWATEDLDKLVGSDFVEVVRWPWVRSQMQSNNHFLFASKMRCKYTAFFDADEFALVGGPIEDNMLKKYISMRRTQGYTQIVFHFLMMLNNGYVRRPKGPLPDLYTRREKDQIVKQGKSIIENDVGWRLHKIHRVEQSRPVRGRTYWNSTMELNPRTIKHNAMLVHYTKRSWEEFVLKNRIGGASVLTKGRPKIVLDVNKPNEKYMDKGQSVEFRTFRERWRKIMKLRDDGAMILIRTGDTFTCRRKWCPGCLFGRAGKEECNSKNNTTT